MIAGDLSKRAKLSKIICDALSTRAYGLNLDYAEVVFHVPWNVNRQIWLNIIEEVATNQRVSSLVDLAAEGIARRCGRHPYPQLMVELIAIHPFAVLWVFLSIDRKHHILGPDVLTCLA